MSKIGKLSDSSSLCCLYNEYYLWERKPVFRQDVSYPSCGSHHVVKCARPLGRRKYSCRDCGKYFLGDASYHHHNSRK